MVCEYGTKWERVLNLSVKWRKGILIKLILYWEHGKWGGGKIWFLMLVQQNNLVYGTPSKLSVLQSYIQPRLDKVIESIIETEYRENMMKLKLCLSPLKNKEKRKLTQMRNCFKWKPSQAVCLNPTTKHFEGEASRHWHSHLCKTETFWSWQ